MATAKKKQEQAEDLEENSDMDDDTSDSGNVGSFLDHNGL